ncbi:hypothetical protein TPHA_0O01700 [Tetrapisispora phaffii CBS 4417]|uniref:MARVEL domain-containing protein n=1 Tax=Tetrapisispora phaffii (strain ATCC 24235 / CBS 4417 / NBRC 1672 / NRRL Y-8282 / UCD 70-5) TaxID=1071381 RepID=G8C1V9_TETPH|nr:hypothetical protein TPHA_0O01700 [Tetrapisispora phaffii CBS 4417]CCE66137.1 hypothetical protein TPHA_0O01700 [Tetrapisispora phaffii CBS 4417]
MLFKRFVNFLTLLFLLGAGLLTFFIILSGSHNSGTLKSFYWFEANTFGFNDASIITRWYDYEFCGYLNDNLVNCSSRAPAKPFSPKDNFGASDNMPSSFLNNRDTYYYLSRVAWAMLLIGLVFICLSIIPIFINIFKLVPGIVIWSTVATWLAFFFIILSACLYTGCYVKARKNFHHDGRHAKLGAKNFAFIWTSVFLLLISIVWTTLLSTLFTRDDHYRKSNYNVASTTVDAEESGIPYNPGAPQPQARDIPTHKKRFFTTLKTRKIHESDIPEDLENVSPANNINPVVS